MGGDDRAGGWAWIAYMFFIANWALWEWANREDEIPTPCQGCADGFDATRRNG